MKNVAEFVRRLGINEGLRLHVYKDTLGNPTIGIGLLLDGAGLGTLHQVGVPDPEAVLQGKADITEAQALAATELIAPRYIQAARNCLNDGVFDALSEARQCAWADMAYNMGEGGLMSFTSSRAILNSAQVDKDTGKIQLAHALFVELGQHLAQSAWSSQVHNRANRDIAMLVSGVYCSPMGDGSDALRSS